MNHHKTNRSVSALLAILMVLTAFPWQVMAQSAPVPVVPVNPNFPGVTIDPQTGFPTSGVDPQTGQPRGSFIDPRTGFPQTIPPPNRSGNGLIAGVVGGGIGAILGANFGIVGTLIGGATGFLAGRWIGKEFGQSPYYDYYDNYYNNATNRRYNDYYSNYYGGLTGGGYGIISYLPTIAGGALGALIGANFGGVLGALAGAAGGALLGHVLANVLFPQSYYGRNYYSYTNPFDDFRRAPPLFQQPNPGTLPVPGVPGAGNTGSVRIGSGRFPYAPSNTPAGSLEELRTKFHDASRDYVKALADGTVEEKAEARSRYQAAEKAYFGAKAAAGK